MAVGALEGRREALGQLARTGGHHDQDGAVGWAAQEGVEQLGRRGVRPVDVVEREHERPAQRQPLEQLPHRAMGAVALVLHDGRAGGCEARQRGQHVRELAAHLLAERREQLRVQAGDELVEGVDEDPERQVALELGGAPREDGAAAGVGAPAQLGQQPGLADPRLALDRERGGPAIPQLAEGAIDRLQFGGAPDEMLGDFGHEERTARRA